MVVNTALDNIERRFDVKTRHVGEMVPDVQSRGYLAYRVGDEVLPVAPYRAHYTANPPEGEWIGQLVELSGFANSSLNVQRGLDAPAAIKTPAGSIWFNAEPFSNWQRWLQLGNDVTPYLA